MPSIPGIFTSVSKRSKPPLDFLSASSAEAPSAASVSSWPSPPRARTTNSRTVWSSSAIRIFAMASLCSGGRILRIEKPHDDVGRGGRRRYQPAAEFQFFPGTKDAAARHRAPGIDFLSRGIPGSEAQAGDLDGLAGNADYGAFHHERGQALLRFPGNLHVFEFQVAQIDRQPDCREQGSRLRQ